MSPVPAPNPVNEPSFSNAAPANGNTWVYNAMTHQWEPGAGGGGADLTAYLGKTDLTGVHPGSVDVPTLFDPSSTNWYDHGWWTMEWQPGISQATMLVGHGDVPNDAGSAWVNLWVKPNFAVVTAQQYNGNGEAKLHVEAADGARVEVTPVVGQSTSTLRVFDENAVARLSVSPTGVLNGNDSDSSSFLWFDDHVRHEPKLYLADYDASCRAVLAPHAGGVLEVILSGLPTADPHAAGHLWANSGVVTVSAG